MNAQSLLHLAGIFFQRLLHFDCFSKHPHLASIFCIALRSQKSSVAFISKLSSVLKKGTSPLRPYIIGGLQSHGPTFYAFSIYMYFTYSHLRVVTQLFRCQVGWAVYTAFPMSCMPGSQKTLPCPLNPARRTYILNFAVFLPPHQNRANFQKTNRNNNPRSPLNLIATIIHTTLRS